jgi:hypothetical protein
MISISNWLFGSSDEGCGHHHFDEYEATDELRIDSRTYIWERGQLTCWKYESIDELRESHTGMKVHVIQRKMKQTCEHEGCGEEQRKWSDERYVPHVEFDGVAYSKEELEAYAEEQFGDEE